VSHDDDWFERAFAERNNANAGEDANEDETGHEETDSADPSTEGGDSSATHRDVAGETGADSPFDQDFSAAFDDAPGPDGPESPGPDGDGSSPPGSSADDVFEAFGMADSFGPSGQGFDDEALDSDLARLELGIEGLDEMILGGIPHRSLIAAIGSAGTGKTTIGMQFLNVALEDGGRGAYITLEESRERVLDTAAEKGWTFREYEDDGRLAIVDLNPVEMANSLGNLRNDLSRLVEEFGAERLVLDSVSLLEMMYDTPAQRRSEVFQFARALKQAGVTMLVTSEANETDPFASRYGIIEYLADAVFVLRYIRSSSFQETRLAVEIQKIRDANHSRQPRPYEITDEGISVHQQANLF
jgi:KaiC domain protein